MNIDSECRSVLSFLRERGSVSWEVVQRDAPVMPTGMMVGLITAGLVSATSLGEEGELIEDTELCLTTDGEACISSVMLPINPS
jgi:hypothetical protein